MSIYDEICEFYLLELQTEVNVSVPKEHKHSFQSRIPIHKMNIFAILIKTTKRSSSQYSSL